jgi:hypothetical protein
MKPYSRFNLLSLLLAVLISSGCEESGIGGGRVCTEIGCDDGVTVQLSEERPDSLSLTIFLDEHSEAFDSVICTEQVSSCVIRAGGITPEKVTVEVKWSNEEFRQTFYPEYESFQPNGPNCPPECRMATIDIDLSGIEE